MNTRFGKELQHLPLNYKGVFLLSLNEIVCNLLIRTQKYIRKGITYRIYPLEEQKSIYCLLLFFFLSLSLFLFRVFLFVCFGVFFEKKSDEAAASSASMVVTALSLSFSLSLSLFLSFFLSLFLFFFFIFFLFFF